MHIEIVNVYIDNIDKSGDVVWQCRNILHSLPGDKTSDLMGWTYENINKGTITQHSFNIQWEGNRVIWSSSRYINDEVVSELLDIAGSITTIKGWLNNSDKGVELISYELYQTEDSN